MSGEKPTGCAFSLFLVAFGVIILLFFGVFIIYGGLGATLFHRVSETKNKALDEVGLFDRAIWNSEYLDSYKSARKNMTKDLANNYFQNGFTKDSVIALCGIPDSTSADTMFYKSGYHMEDELKVAQYMKVVIHNNQLTNVHLSGSLSISYE